MKIKSSLITQASGSIGGLTASRNRGGMYFRARSVPTNPATPYQAAVRALVASLTASWQSALTASSRESWDVFASNVPLIDSLGEPRNVGGLAHFVRANVPRMQAGYTRQTVAPSIFNLGGDLSAPTFGTISAAAGTAEVNFTLADEWTDETGAALLLLFSRPQNPSINYFAGPYRYAGKVEGDDTTPPTSPATITLPFAAAEGQQIFAQARVMRADGRLSLPMRFRGLAGA